MQKLLDFFLGKKTLEEPVPTVSHVDVNQYCGTWFEVAHLPHPFQKNTFCTTATYSPNKDGTIQVYNRTLKGGPTGPVSSIRGKAWAIDETNSKLKVQFFWPLKGNYWVLKRDDNYEWALVGTPLKNHLWILSRTPAMEQKTYDELVEYSKNLGFPTENLIKTYQYEQCLYEGFNAKSKPY